MFRTAFFSWLRLLLIFSPIVGSCYCFIDCVDTFCYNLCVTLSYSIVLEKRAEFELVVSLVLVVFDSISGLRSDFFEGGVFLDEECFLFSLFDDEMLRFRFPEFESNLSQVNIGLYSAFSTIYWFSFYLTVILTILCYLGWARSRRFSSLVVTPESKSPVWFIFLLYI